MVERSLGQLAGLVSRRRRTVFAVWIVLLAAGGWFSLHQSDHLSGGGWEVPGSPSLRVSDALRSDFPSVTPSVFVVFVTGQTPADVRRTVTAAHRPVRADRVANPGHGLYADEAHSDNPQHCYRVFGSN